MMKKTFYATIGFVSGSLLSTAAYTADHTTVDYEVIPDVISYQDSLWTGFYAGVHGGFGLLDTQGSDGIDGENYRTPIGGAHAGFNYQVGSFVLGLEADVSAINIDEDLDTPFADVKADWIGSARARVGYAFDQVMFYATGGGALAHAESTSNTSGVSDDNIHKGYVLGAGVEVFVSHDWVIGAEYLRYELDEEAYQFATTRVRSQGNFDAFRLRVSYAF
ncbi:MAG: outer membrane protein [Hyphomicrobiales bacterium]